MTDKELAAQIQIWFDLNQENKNRWNSSLTGRELKKQLEKLGNWKDRKRWTPPKNQIILNKEVAAKKSINNSNEYDEPPF